MNEVKEIDVEGSETNILYTICDAEFTSDKEFHDTFAKLRLKKGGAGVRLRQYISKRIRAVAARDEIVTSRFYEVVEQIIADQPTK